LTNKAALLKKAWLKLAEPHSHYNIKDMNKAFLKPISLPKYSPYAYFAYPVAQVSATIEALSKKEMVHHNTEIL
jgi:hypothetical protein